MQEDNTMGMRVNAELPLPADLKNEYPLSDKLKAIKAKRDEEIRDIFTGKSDKFVVIIGPCSADNEDSVCEYVNRLAKLNDRVSDKLMIIPRIYTNKPRTTGEGYKGMLHQRIRSRHRICLPESLQSVKCISEPCRRLI